LKILLEHLIGIAADPNVGARAVEVMHLARCATAIVAVRAAMGLARAATATPSILVIRSHASNHFALLRSWLHASPISPHKSRQQQNQETRPIIFRC
jgi:hypothetical protein